MTENKMPELTLDPNEMASVSVPSLTLEAEAPTPAVPAVEEKKEVTPVEMDEKLLTEEERKVVREFSKKIDLTDSSLVLQYGAAAQKSVASFL